MKRPPAPLTTSVALILLGAVLYSSTGCATKAIWAYDGTDWTYNGPTEPFESTRSVGFISVTDVEDLLVEGYSTNETVRATTAYILYPVAVAFMAGTYGLAICYDVLTFPFYVTHAAFAGEEGPVDL